MALPLNRPSLRRKDFDLVLDAMVHDRLVAGEMTAQLTKEILRSWKLAQGELLCSVNEAAARLLKGMNLQSGARVALSALAPQYWHVALLRRGLVPVVQDVEKEIPVLGQSAAFGLKSAGLQAVILDCALGYIPDIPGFEELGIPIILDISQALGGEYRGRSLAHFGSAVLSAFGIETLMAGAGGCFWGLRDATPESLGDSEDCAWERLPDLTAALIFSQWKDLADFVDKKREHLRFLKQKVSLPYFVPEVTGACVPIHPWLTVVVESGAKDVMNYTRKKLITVDWAFRGRTESSNSSTTHDFPCARYFQSHALLFPLYANMSRSELDLLSKVLASLP